MQNSYNSNLFLNNSAILLQFGCCAFKEEEEEVEYNASGVCSKAINLLTQIPDLKC